MLNDHRECKILCVSEHWKTVEQLKMFPISNFVLATSFCRQNGYGGVAIFVQKGTKFAIRAKVNKLALQEQFECVAIECNISNMQYVIVSVYRTPMGNFGLFLEKMENILVQLFTENKRVIIAGDFNVELLKDNVNRTDLLSLMSSFNFNLTIKENTRIVPSGGSCIDNIFVNVDVDQFDTSVWNSFISDHTAQKISFKAEYVNNFRQYHQRFLSNEAKALFIEELKTQDWLGTYSLHRSDVNEQWRRFICVYINIFNHCFPKKLVNKSIKRKCLYKKSVELDDIKKRLDLILILKNQNMNFNNLYKQVKKEYDKLLIKSRAKNYEEKIRTSDNKSKCMWSICNQITGKSGSSNVEFPGEIQEVSNNYNNYLKNVVEELSSNLRQIPWDSHILENDKSMYLKPVTEQEIIELSKKIKNKHSCGDDEIPTSIVKLSIPELSGVLCYIINNSLREGIFPQQLKLALIKPLYKGGDRGAFGSYRPISLLLGFSKLFELVVCDRLVNFMTGCCLFSDNQHGYLQGRSTHTALFQFSRAVLESLDEGALAMGMLLDLSKAYDVLDREILLKKLELYGIRGNALGWIVSYLSERSQRVLINKDEGSWKSDAVPNNMGVPQGSIIGPILFIIFTNDLPCEVVPGCEVTMYADDTNFLVTSDQTVSLIDETKNLFEKTCIWFEKNKLILNENKTKLILFRTKMSKKEKPDNVVLDGKSFDLSKNVKCLGFHIDEFLDWSYHIDSLCGKLSSVCYGIRILTQYIGENALRAVYFANFEGSARYGIVFWGANATISKVFVLQKRVLRIIYKMKYLESCRNVFRSKGILTIYGLYIYEIIMFFYKHKNKFDLTKYHTYNTRTRDINYPTHKLSVFEKGVYYTCIKFYNGLSEDIKNSTSERIFKAKLKKMLIDLEPYCIKDYIQ